MKKFSFSLQKVLDYRRQLESVRSAAFSKAAEVFKQRQKNLESLGEELAQYRSRLAEMGVGRISARELSSYRSYMTHCEIKVSKAAKWLMEAAGEMESRRRDFVGAKKRTRVLERLEEVKRGRHDYEAARQETKVLDEVAGVAFAAVHGSGGEKA